MKKALLMAPMGSVHRRFNQANIQALQALGYEVYLLANFEAGGGTEGKNQEYVKECNEKGIRTYSLPFQRHSLLKNIKLVGKTREIFQEGDFDLIHAHTETGGLICRLAMGGAKESKFCYTPHGMSFYKGSSLKSQLIYRPIEKWISNKMDANLAMNEEEFDIFEAWNTKAAKFVHGIGINCGEIINRAEQEWADRDSLKVPLVDCLLISVGELNENKNHEVVIKALSRLKDKNVAYIICGVGELKGYLQNLVKELDLTDKVFFAGYRNDVPTLLKAADIFVFPSFHEGLPVSIMEAMTVGLPIICSKIRGNIDLIENGKNGYLCDPKSENDFFEVIKTLMDDRDKRLRFGEENRKRSNFYDEKFVQKELMEIYAGLSY